MEPFLTLIALAAGKALTSDAVVGSVIGGVIGNRADGVIVSGVNRLIGLLKGSQPETQQGLQRSIARSVILAKQSIVQDCLKQQLSPEDRRWLEAKGRSLQGDLKKVDQMIFEVLDPEDLGRFLVPEGSEAGAVESLKGQLMQDLEGAPQIYGELARSGLFERVCDRFTSEMQEKPVLRDLLQLQLLTQIRSELPTAAELAAALQVPLSSIEQDVREIKNLLIPPPPSQLPGTAFPENPFKPLSGRIDDPSLFFDQTWMIKEVFDLLNAGSSVALIGERGMGKSSLLKAIARVSQAQLQRQAVYIDWNLVQNEETFWGIVCNQIRVPPCNNSELVKAIESRRLLLLLDEVEKMERQVFGEEIRTQLRGFANGDNMKVVVAACVSLDVLFPGEAHSLISLFNNLCTEARISAWNYQMVTAYIDQRLQGIPIHFTDQERQKIYQQSEGNPQKLVKHCHQLYRDYRNHYVAR